MVLAPFYQDFMKSLDEHINELVEGIEKTSIELEMTVKCSRMMKTLQFQINDLRRENQRLRSDLKIKRPNGVNGFPKLDKEVVENGVDHDEDEEEDGESMTVIPTEAPPVLNGNGHLNGMPSLIDAGFKRELSPGNDSTDDESKFTNHASPMDDCPDLEEITTTEDTNLDNDYRFPSVGMSASLSTTSDNYGEKTIDEDEMEAYFNDENFLCRLCNRQLCSRHSLMRHVKTVHTRVRRYKCEYCDSTFKSADVKKVHVKNVHANEKALAELTTSLTSMDDKESSNSTPTKKPKLENTTTTTNSNGFKEDSISALVEVNDNTESKKIFSCSICKMKFSSRGEISGHSRRVHGNAKPFNCEICGAGFTRIGTLNMHMKKHTL